MNDQGRIAMKRIGGWMAAAVLFGATGASANTCGDFPAVPWWGGLTAERVADTVRQQHQGNWQDYVKKWEGEAEKLRDMHARGAAAVIRSHDLRLEGDDLLAYVEQVQKRVEVTRCVAANRSAGGPAPANPLAASGDRPPPPKVQ